MFVAAFTLSYLHMQMASDTPQCHPINHISHLSVKNLVHQQLPETYVAAAATEPCAQFKAQMTVVEHL